MISLVCSCLRGSIGTLCSLIVFGICENCSLEDCMHMVAGIFFVILFRSKLRNISILRFGLLQPAITRLAMHGCRILIRTAVPLATFLDTVSV